MKAAAQSEMVEIPADIMQTARAIEEAFWGQNVPQGSETTVAGFVAKAILAERERLQRELAAMQQTVEFVVRQAWREDPPHANHKLTDSERLSAIKFYPSIKDAARATQRPVRREENRDE